eukprot:3157560-Rhodomonas_salina.2
MRSPVLSSSVVHSEPAQGYGLAEASARASRPIRPIRSMHETPPAYRGAGRRRWGTNGKQTAGRRARGREGREGGREERRALRGSTARDQGQYTTFHNKKGKVVLWMQVLLYLMSARVCKERDKARSSPPALERAWHAKSNLKARSPHRFSKVFRDLNVFSESSRCASFQRSKSNLKTSPSSSLSQSPCLCFDLASVNLLSSRPYLSLISPGA